MKGFKLTSFLLLLTCQLVYANCTPTHILSLIGDNSLHNDYYREVIRGKIEVCTYYLNEMEGSDYVYKLLHNNEVVYCGITNRTPVDRAMEHSNPSVNNKDYKLFNKMVAVGYFSDGKAARKKEKSCVCEHNPIYNKRPACNIKTKFNYSRFPWLN